MFLIRLLKWDEEITAVLTLKWKFPSFSNKHLYALSVQIMASQLENSYLMRQERISN